jgi:hypothetical protein
MRALMLIIMLLFACNTYAADLDIFFSSSYIKDDVNILYPSLFDCRTSFTDTNPTLIMEKLTNSRDTLKHRYDTLVANSKDGNAFGMYVITLRMCIVESCIIQNMLSTDENVNPSLLASLKNYQNILYSRYKELVEDTTENSWKEMLNRINSDIVDELFKIYKVAYATEIKNFTLTGVKLSSPEVKIAEYQVIGFSKNLNKKFFSKTSLIKVTVKSKERNCTASFSIATKSKSIDFGITYNSDNFIVRYMTIPNEICK